MLLLAGTLSDAGVERLLNKLPLLTELDLQQCKQLKGTVCIATLARSCPAMERLSLRRRLGGRPLASPSTRILGRRMAPSQPFLIPNRVPHGVTQRS